MIWWVRIYSTPMRQFYLPGSRGGVDLQQYSAGILDPAATLSADVDSEGGHMSITLQNSMGQVTQIFAQPPLGAQAEVLVADVVVFSGAVTAITLDQTATVELQA